MQKKLSRFNSYLNVLISRGKNWNISTFSVNYLLFCCCKVLELVLLYNKGPDHLQLINVLFSCHIWKWDGRRTTTDKNFDEDNNLVDNSLCAKVFEEREPQDLRLLKEFLETSEVKQDNTTYTDPELEKFEGRLLYL